MSLIRRKKSKGKSENVQIIVPEKSPCIKKQHINYGEYEGQTVTVFVNSGGAAGNGFTGVLLLQTDSYLKLLILPSAPPQCSLGNACCGKDVNLLFCTLCPYNRTLGSVAEIPLEAVTAFVHNSI
ncbi:hypothetical protein [Ruminiclostridium papyrosolvens]|uniref:Uncharacterized protein n=1 Tax=Ruminiclostridium papyrosolvens C7 TaxID=1330534 RepID=U4R3F5_9FIRM|nr:hypothetical protein [Ruminiclostridium papyrosolvens]EPR12918.1 hypothetical protein L323_06350 [Ruminiclostridium papyrosolvens C7]